ncbi:MAG: RNA polymerase-binding protein DksA [Arcobacteraceae bacterium]|nr:RNA polymerase-binding protein DksA [Arcobacteraceae bacterium]
MASTKQIEELREILEVRKIQIESNIEDSKNNIAQLQNMDCKDDFDFAESSSDSFTSEVIAVQQSKELVEINSALKDIKDGKYGICDMCDELIALRRLKAKPFAKFCTTCREIFENKKR